VTAGGLVGNITDPKASRQPLRPDEVLFKQKNAPIRYEETDYYFAHEKLPADKQLPSSDLLSALHAYVSKLYSRTAGPETEKAWRSMDETALIAFGILLEETAREMMGETGDLAFTEAADDADEERASRGEGQDEHDEHDEDEAASVKTTGVAGSESTSSSGDEDTSDDST
jgi:hypothetical protein